jgi:hypothetical protein
MVTTLGPLALWVMLALVEDLESVAVHEYLQSTKTIEGARVWFPGSEFLVIEAFVFELQVTDLQVLDLLEVPES